MKCLVAAVLAAGALSISSAASAATIFDGLDQTRLDTLGTDTFGAIIDATGGFSHTFTFDTTEDAVASSTLVTIRLKGGGADIDFSAVDLDGTAFTPFYGAPGHEPGESWSLASILLAPGSHAIHVSGTVVDAAASYDGTLNIFTCEGRECGGGGSGGAVPEPATWAMMILGFGGAGAMLRRRRGALA